MALKYRVPTVPNPAHPQFAEVKYPEEHEIARSFDGSDMAVVLLRGSTPPAWANEPGVKFLGEFPDPEVNSNPLGNEPPAPEPSDDGEDDSPL
jgi:hypothetical protein